MHTILENGINQKKYYDSYGAITYSNYALVLLESLEIISEPKVNFSMQNADDR